MELFALHPMVARDIVSKFSPPIPFLDRFSK